jgi:ElaB/YqjD/DUF883 family membrane-anchored ribosome-binding protein
MDDNEPLVIRHQMAETRTSLTDKLETLEQKAAETVETVTATVANVKEAVHESVDAVKSSVHETVATVKDTLDLKRQVQQHPWVMFGGSIAMGFISGRLLGKSNPGRNGQRLRPASLYSNRFRTAAHPNGDLNQEMALARDGEEGAPATSAATQENALAGNLFGPELAKLKRLAIGTTMGVVREVVTSGLAPSLQPKVGELIDDVTVKLGGELIPGSILGHHES